MTRELAAHHDPAVLGSSPRCSRQQPRSAGVSDGVLHAVMAPSSLAGVEYLTLQQLAGYPK